jgi:hypothetical protein
MRIKEFIIEAAKPSIKSIVPPSVISSADHAMAFAHLSEIEINQLGQPRYISKEMWPQFRKWLVERSQASNPQLDPNLTAYTPGETLALFSHPEIAKWHQEVVHYKVPPEYKMVAFVPCGKTKPWANAARGIYKSYNRIIKDQRYPVYFVTVSEPLGIVPSSLWSDFPQYDNPGLFKDDTQQSGGLFTSDWQKYFHTGKQKMPFDPAAYQQCIEILGNIIKKFIENNPQVQYVSFVEDKMFKVSSNNVGTHSAMLSHTGKLDPAHRYLKRAAPREEPYSYVDQSLSGHFSTPDETPPTI